MAHMILSDSNTGDISRAIQGRASGSGTTPLSDLERRRTHLGLEPRALDGDGGVALLTGAPRRRVRAVDCRYLCCDIAGKVVPAKQVCVCVVCPFGRMKWRHPWV